MRLLFLGLFLLMVLLPVAAFASHLDLAPHSGHFERIGPDGEIYIHTAEQLANIQMQANLYIESDGQSGSLEYLTIPGNVYVLGQDIDLPPGFTPIGDAGTHPDFIFRGSFDGRGHTITGLSQGLFGSLDGASVSNLVIADANIKITSKEPFAAGILADNAQNSIIKNVTIENSEISALKGGSGIVGGLVGLAIDTKFYDSSVKASTVIGPAADNGKNATGGFAGRLEGTGLVLECHSHAHVSGGMAGGFVGQASGSPLAANANHRLEIIQSSATGKVVSTGGIAGGFIGEGAYAHIKDCAAYGDVEGHTGAGGFVGRLTSRSRVIYSYARGDVFLEGQGGFAGGFIGKLTGSACVEFSYSAGSVLAGHTSVEAMGTTGAMVGGFVGVITDDGIPNTITHSLSFSPWVVGDGYVHRFAGRMEHDGVNGCFAYLGSMVVRGGKLVDVIPSAYGSDGGDMSMAQVEAVAKRLGWRREVLIQ